VVLPEVAVTEKLLMVPKLRVYGRAEALSVQAKAHPRRAAPMVRRFNGFDGEKPAWGDRRPNPVSGETLTGEEVADAATGDGPLRNDSWI
jgi:hypothetical protein